MTIHRPGDAFTADRRLEKTISTIFKMIFFRCTRGRKFGRRQAFAGSDGYAHSVRKSLFHIDLREIRAILFSDNHCIWGLPISGNTICRKELRKLAADSSPGGYPKSRGSLCSADVGSVDLLGIFPRSDRCPPTERQTILRAVRFEVL